jgi:hypothetical protein
VDDQHGSRARVEHLVADAAQDDERTLPPRAHHHEVVFPVPYLLEDSVARPPVHQPRRHGHARRYLSDRLVQKLPIFALGLLVERDILDLSTVRGADQQPRRRVRTGGHDREPSVVALGEVNRLGQRAGGVGCSIECDQDVAKQSALP